METINRTNRSPVSDGQRQAHRKGLDDPDAEQSLGVIMAFVVIIIGWTVHKIFGSDPL